jgi:hypothetical protein
MIKFFRLIRKSLLEQNKMGKYFKYAIGEILLVVIGILIALQINNWNETRKGRIEEKKILASLLEDFRETQENLEASLKWHPRDLNRLDSIVNYFGFDQEEVTPNMKQKLRSTGFVYTKIVQERLVGLLSSENFQLISNDSLKKRLTTYPSTIEVFKEVELDVKNIVFMQHRPKLAEYVSFTDLSWIRKNQEKYPNLKTFNPKLDYKDLLGDHDFQNIIVDEIFLVRDAKSSAEDLLVQTIEIAEIIEQELKTRN